MKAIQNIHIILTTAMVSLTIWADSLCAVVMFGFNSEYKQPRNKFGFNMS